MQFDTTLGSIKTQFDTTWVYQNAVWYYPDTTHSEMSSIKSRSDTTNSKMSSIKSRFDTTHSKMSSIKSRFDTTHSKMSSIKMCFDTTQVVSKRDLIRPACAHLMYFCCMAIGLQYVMPNANIY